MAAIVVNVIVAKNRQSGTNEYYSYQSGRDCCSAAAAPYNHHRNLLPFHGGKNLLAWRSGISSMHLPKYQTAFVKRPPIYYCNAASSTTAVPYLDKVDFMKLQNGSDIRGVAVPGVEGEPVTLTEPVTEAIAAAFSAWLSEKKKVDASKPLKVSVGHDSRISAQVLQDAVTRGVASAGLDVVQYGLASTPAMFNSTLTEDEAFLCPVDGAIMITASHLPYNRNGFKFFTNAGGLGKADIKNILERAVDIYNSFTDEGLMKSKRKASESLKRVDYMTVYTSDLVKAVRKAAGNIEKPLEGFHIVVDAGNGAGGFFAEKVLQPLGAITSGSQFLEPDGMFPNHIPNPEDKTAMKAITQAVLENKADLGIIFDTDVDRSAVVDSTAREFNRNRLIALMSAIVLEEHPGTTIVTDSVTSDGLTTFIENKLVFFTESDSVEPVTPAGRLFLLPEMNTIIHCAFGVKNKIDIDSTRSVIKNSLMLKHPRFCSLLVRDKNGREHWKKTDIDIDQHFIIVNKKTCTDDDGDDVDKAVNEYIADLSVSTPLDMNKPLWEVHVMLEKKCAIMRIHHALGDGISLMSMFLASCRTASDPEAIPTLVTGRRPDCGKEGKQQDWRGVILRVLKMVWFGMAFSLEFVLRFLWVSDKKTVISGGDGVELWPRKLATAKFLIEDMKTVKGAVANATINDVLFGVISSGLSRYLDHRSPKALKEGQQITGMAMVNLREQLSMQDLSEMLKNNSGSQSRWGNRFGFILLPVFYRKSDVDPLQHVGRAKTMIDRKKKTLEAHFAYHIGHLAMSLLGPKAAYVLNYRVLCNTTFTFSNVVGPQEVVTMSGNPVTFLRVNTSSIPHALTMHMVSYAGRADMQIMVAKDIIPDPEFLAKCFEDALFEMKEAAAATI